MNPQILSVSNPEPQGMISAAEGNVLRLKLPNTWSPSAAVLDELRVIRAELNRTAEAISIPITTLAPEPYELVRDIPAVVQPVGDEFVATFFDANISSSGDSQEEAVANLRSLLLDTFEYLESEPSGALGPEPTRQFGVLRVFLKRI